MPEHHAPRSHDPDLDVDVLASDLDELAAEEQAELAALGDAIGAAYSGVGADIDADGVASLWERIDPGT